VCEATGTYKTTKVLRVSSKKLATSSGKTFQTLVTIQLDLGGGNTKTITTALRNVKENLGDNGGGYTSTGSMQFSALDPHDAEGDPQEAGSRVQSNYTELFYTYVRDYCWLLESGTIPPMAMEGEIAKVQTLQGQHRL
jgi:hypothetical protein